MEEKLTYASAGVNIENANEAVDRIKKQVKRTYNKNVLGGLGSFGGLFELGTGYKEPVLVSGTDGVGTKLKVAFLCDKHNTVGIDLVAMCVNDIICQGAKPLFFLDYIATGIVSPENIEDIVSGIADGCVQAGTPLLGGETAEMPDFYQSEEYDLAGFTVGIVEKEKLITGDNINEGDILVGLPSNGIHSNGYSLVRKVFFEKLKMETNDFVDEFNSTLGEELLKPTKIYVNDFLKINDKLEIKGMVHVTGGGFYENIPRVLPDGLSVSIEKNSWEIPNVFKYIEEKGNVETKEMFTTFNMGIGMILVIKENDFDIIKNELKDAKKIGKVVKGDFGVELWD
ncbi:phosphoribosylformylglycinamidine cyclo-ligase [Clostridiaceae bacterium HSG29]|nr:phosphoribosylformylglycinamidine cyclo-ligase [Clostridiaceae bacterium HSG29]